MKSRDFYLITLVLLALLFLVLFTGQFMVSYIVATALTLFLVAVAQHEWEENGRKWR